MSEQKFIPYPAIDFFKNKLAPPDALNVIRAQQEKAPLFMIDRIVCAGWNHGYAKNERGDMFLVRTTEATDCPKEGIFIFHEGVPFPIKGWVTPHASKAIYPSKKALINFIKTIATKDLGLAFLGIAILPKRIKIRILERFLKNFREVCDLTMGEYYWEENYKMVITKSVEKFIKVFLITLGVSEQIAATTAEALGTFLEYDDAYRYRMEDIMSETSQGMLYKNPRQEVARLIEMLLVREGSEHVAVSFKSVSKVASLILLSPWIKKAFKAGLEAVDIKDMQLDEADRYHVGRLAGYDFFGKKIEDRILDFPPDQRQVVFIH